MRMSAARRHGPAHRAGAHPREARRGRDELLPRLAAILDMDPHEVVEHLSGDRRQSIRINALSPRPPQEIERDLDALGVERTPIDWCPGAYHLTSDKAVVANSRLFIDGDVYIQNASSLIPPLALDPHPGQAILDLCAAPGGKSAQIAALTGNQASLWLNDGIKARIAKLDEVIGRFHVRPVEITTHPAQYADKYIDRTFDRILLDAQCSGEGLLDLSHPNALRFWSLRRVREYGLLQQRMLMAAYKLLAPGGILVYSTCTFAPEENEAPIDHLLRHRENADIAPIGVTVAGGRGGLSGWERSSFDPRLRHALRVVPSRFMEGFFVCKIVKRA
jgi:16S rRNA C967 or C1407 C5-methylase (RsmB/RsmF family)